VGFWEGTANSNNRLRKTDCVRTRGKIVQKKNVGEEPFGQGATKKKVIRSQENVEEMGQRLSHSPKGGE